jgi:hypothetical protein
MREIKNRNPLSTKIVFVVPVFEILFITPFSVPQFLSGDKAIWVYD